MYIPFQSRHLGETNIFIDTSNSGLVNSFDNKIRLPEAGAEIIGPNFAINSKHTAASAKLLSAYTTYGTKFMSYQNTALAYVPTSQAKAEINFSSTQSYMNDSTLQNISLGSSNDYFTHWSPAGDEKYVLTSKAIVQTIADGIVPGEVVLQIPINGIDYNPMYNTPIPFGTETGTEIRFMGKNYLVKDATATRIILEDIQ